MKKQITGLVIGVLGIAGTAASLLSLPGNLRAIILIPSLIAVAFGLVYYLIYIRFKIIPYIQRPKDSFEEEIKNSSEIWVAWHTGSVKFAEGGMFEGNRKYKILLTKPESIAINELGKVANIRADELNLGINGFTRIIKEKNHEIRWFDGFLGSSMIISDPEKESAWIRIEAFIPYLGAKLRPSIKFFKRHNEEEFIRFKEIFNDMWEKSITP